MSLFPEMLNRPETIIGIYDILNSNTISGTAPRAGLNYLFFDEQMNLLSGSGRIHIGPVFPGIFENLSTERVTATDPGFVIVYVDNQTIGKDVWFDNVQVLHYNTKVLEENHYYPYGLTISSTAMGSTAQPYKLTSKELEKSFNINAYDFGARNYDMQLGRWMGIDELSEKYYNLSPYHFCGNNPVRYLDLDGREFTEGSMPHIDKYLKEVQKRIDNDNTEIASLRSRISSNDIKESRGNKLIAKAEARISQMKEIQTELNVLEKSDQVYDLVLSNKSNSSTGIVTKEIVSGFSFNVETGVAEIFIGDGSLEMISHEVKHAYQFETGLLSGGKIIVGSSHPYLLYDKTDEIEAYNRGALFGGKVYNIWNLDEAYLRLPSQPTDFNSIPFFQKNGNSPQALQTFSRSTKTAFRNKGVTYYPNKK